MKSILLYCFNLGGGAGKNITSIANHYSDLGYNVTVAFGRSQPHLKSQICDNVHIRDLKSRSSYSALFGIAKQLRKYSFDIIFVTGASNAIIITMALLFIKNNNKVIIREASSPSMLIRDQNWCIGFLKKYLIKWSYRNCNVIIALTNEMKNDLINTWKVDSNKIKVIYNGINMNNYKTDYETLNTYQKLLLEKKKRYYKILVNIGNLNWSKNHELLIRAFDKIKYRNKILFIVGSGDRRSYLENIIKNENIRSEIIFTGQQENAEYFIKNCDLFVLSSRYEGFPNVLLESLKYGKTIVSTDCPTGPREIIGDNEYGYLVPTDYLDKMVETIEMSLGKPFSEVILKERAKYFSIEKQMDEYKNILISSI